MSAQFRREQIVQNKIIGLTARESQMDSFILNLQLTRTTICVNLKKKILIQILKLLFV
jgi:hypothetical protein